MKRLSIVVSIYITLALATGAVFAQGSANGQFAKFQESHKYTFQLSQMARHISEIDKDPKYTLTPAQAKQVLGVLKPLKTKPKLTQDQAKDALKELKKPLTVNQLNAIARIKPKPATGNRPGGQESARRQGGTSRPSGQNPPRTGDRASRPTFDANEMKNFNPFYSKPGAKDEQSKRTAARWNDFFNGLERKAKSANAPAAKPKSTAPAKGKTKK